MVYFARIAEERGYEVVPQVLGVETRSRPAFIRTKPAYNLGINLQSSKQGIHLIDQFRKILIGPNHPGVIGTDQLLFHRFLRVNCGDPGNRNHRQGSKNDH
ncbi:hypothetical protein D3C75_1089470 [compost metagenome]